MKRRPLIWNLLFALACLVGTLALPVPLWRTGRMPVPPLTLSTPEVTETPERLWIDTDAACGHTTRTDVDDCLAVWLLGTRFGGEIVALSTVHGNAALEVTDTITRELVGVMAEETGAAAVYRGAPAPIASRPAGDTEARAGLTRALESGPLTIVALGPLTNVAHILMARPDLRHNVEQLIAVMGRRVGHLFHPAEASGRGSLLGHGPVFRDFNFSADPDAVEALLQMDLRLTLLPYDAAVDVEITREHLRQLAMRDETGAWIAARSEGWLEYWLTDIGRAGFYPFDLMAAAYVIAPSLFRCAGVQAWVGTDPVLFIPFLRPKALLVEPHDARTKSRTAYCPAVEPEFHGRMKEWISNDSGRPPPANGPRDGAPLVSAPAGDPR
jgi:inosine-uridine nucleoside N-ribohydrolase